MKDNKDKYIYNHTLSIKESLETIKANLKWIFSDIKIIEKISKPTELNHTKKN